MRLIPTYCRWSGRWSTGMPFATAPPLTPAPKARMADAHSPKALASAAAGDGHSSTGSVFMRFAIRAIVEFEHRTLFRTLSQVIPLRSIAMISSLRRVFSGRPR